MNAVITAGWGRGIGGQSVLTQARSAVRAGRVRLVARVRRGQVRAGWSCGELGAEQLGRLGASGRPEASRRLANDTWVAMTRGMPTTQGSQRHKGWINTWLGNFGGGANGSGGVNSAKNVNDTGGVNDLGGVYDIGCQQRHKKLFRHRGGVNGTRMPTAWEVSTTERASKIQGVSKT